MAIRPQREKSCQLSAVSYQPDSKVKSVFSPNFACFASSRLAPWNTHSTEVELFAHGPIPQGETSSLLLTLCALRHTLCSNRSAKICENLRLKNPIALRYAPCALPFPVCKNLRKSAVKSPTIVRDGASFVCRPLPTNKNSNSLRLCSESLSAKICVNLRLINLSGFLFSSPRESAVNFSLRFAPCAMRLAL